MVSDVHSGHAYDAFLFESLGIQENGMDLSVLSALARAGVDPWVEAKRLAALPRQGAINAILKFTGDDETARRLADLLPRVPTALPASPEIEERERLFRRYGLLVIIAWLMIAIAFMMYSQNGHTLTPTVTPSSIPIVQH